MSNSSRSGFTLIELMVVVTVIAVISTLAFALFSNAQKTTRDSIRIQEIQEVQKALEQYYATNGGYVSSGTDGGAIVVVNALAALNSYYPKNKPPSDPSKSEVNNYEYNYYSCGEHPATVPPVLAQSYIVCARLVNPTGKANITDTMTLGVPWTNGCSWPTATQTTPIYYCLKSLSN